MLNKLLMTKVQGAVLFLVILVSASSTSANPVCVKCTQQNRDSSPEKAVNFTVHISEAGKRYNEKIQVDPNKRTELFEVPAHPGVDRSDVLHDFKQNLTMMRFPETNVCYLLPLLNEVSNPEKLIRDLERSSKMVITETRRVDTTWIINGELTDQSALSQELAQFCANYPIYHVKKAPDSLTEPRIETERTNRERRQSAPQNKLCAGGMDLITAYRHCLKPDYKCRVTGRNCHKYVICSVGGPGEPPPPEVFSANRRYYINSAGKRCFEDHIWSSIICCQYVCS